MLNTDNRISYSQVEHIRVGLQELFFDNAHARIESGVVVGFVVLVESDSIVDCVLGIVLIDNTRCDERAMNIVFMRNISQI